MDRWESLVRFQGSWSTLLDRVADVAYEQGILGTLLDGLEQRLGGRVGGAGMTPNRTEERVADLEQRLRMIVSHASGGRLHERESLDWSINDVCVAISRHKNEIWVQAQKSALTSTDNDVPGLVEALERIERKARDTSVRNKRAGITTNHNYFAEIIQIANATLAKHRQSNGADQ
jgi:hypothetical protein